MMAMAETAPSGSPCSLRRNETYRSCVPWLKKLNAVIITMANTARPAFARNTDSRPTLCRRCRCSVQSGLSGTWRRMYRTSSAGSAPTMNMPRQPSAWWPSPNRIEASR